MGVFDSLGGFLDDVGGFASQVGGAAKSVSGVFDQFKSIGQGKEPVYKIAVPGIWDDQTNMASPPRSEGVSTNVLIALGGLVLLLYLARKG